MTNHENWRMHYQMHRYMEFLTLAQLKQRVKDIYSNLFIFSEDGKIGLRPINEEGKYWMILWTEILEEFRLRYGEYPNGFESDFIKGVIPNNFEKIAIEAKQVIDSIGGIKKHCLYKFGKANRLSEMYEVGKIRISPASSYDNTSFNDAIRDEELKFVTSFSSKHTTITNITENSEIKALGNVPHEYNLKTDYYLHSLSTTYSMEKFIFFSDYDACLIIYDGEKYMDLVAQETHKQLSNYKCYFGEVDYIDPVKTVQSPNVFFAKHFRFSLQNEYRLAWVPNSDTFEKDLEHIFIDIGTMKDYAKLIYIER